MAAEQRRAPPAWRRGRLATIRVRTTVAAVAVVGLALGVGSVVLVTVVRDTLTREVRAAARLRGQDVAAVLASDAAGRGSLAVDDPQELVIQVLDEDGRVVEASPNAAGLPPVARLGPGESSEVEVPIEDGPFLAVATGADTPLGRRTVLVVRSSDAVGETTAVVSGLLAVGLPLLLAVVAVTTWTVVGRALAPVEAIRAEVDAISAAGLHRRVPDPAADDEIGRLARTMNRMLGRLEQAQARQRRLVSDASHELRSPVATIRQHAEVALAHPGRTTTTELAATVLAEDLRLQRLAEDLLLLTQVDEHTLAMRRRPVDLDDLVFDEARRLREATGLRVDTTAVFGWWWTTTAPASPRRTASGSSSGSCASTAPAPGPTAAAVSAWPSWPSWSPPTAARSASPPAPSGVPGSRSPSPGSPTRATDAWFGFGRAVRISWSSGPQVEGGSMQARRSHGRA